MELTLHSQSLIPTFEFWHTELFLFVENLLDVQSKRIECAFVLFSLCNAHIRFIEEKNKRCEEFYVFSFACWDFRGLRPEYWTDIWKIKSGIKFCFTFLNVLQETFVNVSCKYIRIYTNRSGGAMSTLKKCAFNILASVCICFFFSW